MSCRACGHTSPERTKFCGECGAEVAGGAVIIRLYSYALSPFAAKVHCYLCYKGLEFETFYVHPFKVRDELPLGCQVPVLEIDGEYKNDSTPIGLWLERKFPESQKLLPVSRQPNWAQLSR